jgi:hypothetical protein
MDTKPGLAAPLPESEAATLAPSKASVSDEVETEKNDALARQATATSKTGKKLEPTPTREDGTEYPGGLTLGLIVLALCLSVFTMALGAHPLSLSGLCAQPN